MDEQELIRRAQKLIKRFDNMRIIGSRGEWSGSSRLGFMFNPQRGGSSGSGGGPVIQTGACCLDGDCFETTQVACVSAGGTYQGNGTVCSSVTVNCTEATSGACCVLDNCSIETPEHCGDIGGTYQGDGTTCDPNPCTTRPDCACGFEAFDGSGRRFLTQTESFTDMSDGFYTPTGHCIDNGAWQSVTAFDPTTCDVSIICSGEDSITDTGACGDRNLTWTDVGGVCGFTGGIPGCSANCLACTFPAFTIDSATRKHTDCEVHDFQFGNPYDVVMSYVIQLSDECNPI